MQEGCGTAVEFALAVEMLEESFDAGAARVRENEELVIGRMKPDRLFADREQVPRLTQPGRSCNPTEALSAVGESHSYFERADNKSGLGFDCERSEARNIDLAFCEAG